MADIEGNQSAALLQQEETALSSLFLPWITDPWGHRRPPVSNEAARLSVRLARDTYHMAVESWIQRGWQDVTFQLNGHLMNHLEWAAGAPRIRQEIVRIHRSRVRKRLRGSSAVGSMAGVIRQRSRSDTGKVLLMAHPGPDGRWIIAVSFMGTGRSVQDWISNFRMTLQDGFHRGFLELTRQFEQNAESIHFPETAAALGMEDLTFAQVLQSLTLPDSPFRLWLCGHSQGAAIMQLWCLRRIQEGVLPQNMIGWGFASPSVADGTAVKDPADFPLYHLVNSDDLVPRTGSQVHLGLLLIYPADDTLRNACYRKIGDHDAATALALIRPLANEIQDTSDALISSAALLTLIQRLSPEDMSAVLRVLQASGKTVRSVLEAADNRMDALLGYAIRGCCRAYRSIYGADMPEQRLADRINELEPAFSRLGAKRFLSALWAATGAPHSCSGKNSAYFWIAEHGFAELIPACWTPGAPPKLHVLTKNRDSSLKVRRAPHRRLKLSPESPGYERKRQYARKAARP